MAFEWDSGKERRNVLKHQVSFEEAAQVFNGFILLRADTRRDYGEPRWIALGVDSNGVILNVVHTVRGENTRIISAWKASKHERKTYEEARAARAETKPHRPI
jgi:hypothetical protein